MMHILSDNHSMILYLILYPQVGFPMRKILISFTNKYVVRTMKQILKILCSLHKNVIRISIASENSGMNNNLCSIFGLYW